MRVLIACEFSGRVRDAFRARGHDAVSCDLLPTEVPGPHVEGDVRDMLGDGWDLLIAHPPCTYLANSGVRWLHTDPDRWPRMLEGAAFFKAFLQADVPLIAVENPIMHRYGMDAVGQRPSFTVQPWQFGDPEKKRTCFWTKGLRPLIPLVRRPPDDLRQSSYLMSPSPDRWKHRSRTFPGLANAMAEQWGSGVLL